MQKSGRQIWSGVSLAAGRYAQERTEPLCVSAYLSEVTPPHASSRGPQTRPLLRGDFPSAHYKQNRSKISDFPSQARKDQKISPVLLSVCTPPFSAKAKVASADATETNRERETS